MKVLIITPIFPPEIGGPATYSEELLQRLSPEITVKVVSFTNVTPVQKNPNVIFIPTTGGTMVRQIKLFLSCLKHGLGCDIFYIQEPAVVGLAALIAAEFLGKKIVVKYVGDPSWENAQNSGKTNFSLEKYLGHKKKSPDFLFRVSKAVLKNCDLVVTPSHFLKNVLSVFYSVRERNIVVISNAVDVSGKIFSKKEDTIIFVGRLVAWKNVDLVIDAFGELVRKKAGKYQLLVVGDGPQRANLEKQTGRLKIESRVKFLGDLSHEETLNNISRSKILVLYSDYEGLSHVILEAQARGTLVVVSDIPGNREAVGDKMSGFIVPPHNPKSLAQVLAAIVTNKTDMRNVTRIAMINVKKRNSWGVNLKTLKENFYGLLKD